MVETGQRAQLGNFNRTNQNILDIERCEREKDGFVTVFPIQIEKTPQRVFKTFFLVDGKFVAILFFCFIFF